MATLDVVVGLAVLTTALLLTIQLSIWVLSERQRTSVRQQALEETANVLESAQACSWDDLGSTWAGEQEQRLRQALAERMTEPVFAVRVQPEKDRPRTRRITVELKWKQPEGWPAPPITMTALFSKRTEGGQP